MIQTGFESRVKIQQIIDSQLPEFILDESPKAAEFLKQYYISQEYQGGTTDISENLDQYIKIDNLTPEVVVGYTILEENITSFVTSITVSSTRGFPSKYGILKIDDEIITYTGITGNTFTGCIRGFSGVTNYHKDLQYGELVFNQSSASSHVLDAKVQNLSSLFLQEFYKKIKFSLTPGLEGLDFTENIDVGNFIKEARTLYESKGTPESFRILFNVLYGETAQVIDLERFLIKTSDAGYIRRDVAIISNISGDPTKLVGQTIKKTTDEFTSATVSEVETISRDNITYYKLNFFIGYDDTYPNVAGTFTITPNTKVIEEVTVTPSEGGVTVISVDSTVGFAKTGSIFFGSSEIFYSDKSVNQFLGCHVGTASTIEIPKTSSLISNETYYGYENNDATKKVEFRITGVLSNLDIENVNYELLENDVIYPKNLGQVIEKGNSAKEIFANSWIYNTSSRYQIESFVGNKITTKSNVDSASLTIGDFTEILQRNTEIVVSGFENAEINSISGNEVTINVNTSSLNPLVKYDIRRKIKKASSSIVPIDFGNDKLISDVQNVYIERPDYLYVASNSLPSYEIRLNLFKYNIFELTGYNGNNNSYSIIDFNTEVSFINGDRVFYSPDINNPIIGLEEGSYFVEVLSNKRQIKLYLSNPVVGTDDFIYFGTGQSSRPVYRPLGTHNFTLYSQRSNKISGQKILKKFKLNPELGSNESHKTLPGPIGLLKNGVEIYNFKTNDKIYYGPIKNIDVLNGGEEFDVINHPLLELSYGNAEIQPVIIGSVKKIFVDPQDFDIDVVVSVALTGGNGSGANFKPIIQKYAREIEFDARSIFNGGGLDTNNDRISFASSHNLVNGQPIIYDNNYNSAIGVGTFNGSNLDQSKTLVNGSIYYAKVVNDKTIEIYQSLSDYTAGINTVGFTTIGNSGIQKFKTEPKNRLTEISVINGGSGYANRILKISQEGISTHNNTITFKNHGFEDGEIISYTYETTAISGLSTSNNYIVLKLDSDTFRLCNAGIAGTDISNYQRKNYSKFTSTGSGYQIFKYPDIKLSIEYSSVGLGSTQVRGIINATPIIRGKISEVYVYNKGSDYGSTTLNVHKRPQVIIKNGENAQLRPIIVNGRISDIQVLYGGKDYYSVPDLVISGSGIGAIARPIITNNKITDVIIINSGTGYKSTDTSIIVTPAGKNEVLKVNIRELTLNSSHKYGVQNEFYRNPSSEVLIENNETLKYAVIGYSQNIKSNFKDPGDLLSEHSDIIGWAYDGNPIYGSFGYSDPNDINSDIKKLEPGYSLTNIENRPSETDFLPGYFIEDYEYNESGDLDQYNGRFGKTKDFPQGVYAYFATTEINRDGQLVGKFPYFIGNEYRSPYLSENIDLDQSFDFNNSKLLRNTLPYNVNQEYADNDFIIESNEIVQQKTLVESVSSGSVSGFEIIKSGTDYAVGDSIIFDDTKSSGGGISAEVSRIEGKDIVNINTSIESYEDSIVEWQNKGTVKVYISPYHNFKNIDNINISGLSTQVSNLNGYYKIGLTTHITTLYKSIPNFASTGIVTDIYLTSIPENISIGSSIQIENEIFSVLNVYSNFGIVRVDRSSAGVSHTQTTPVYFLPNSFTVNKNIEYFDSQNNSKIYFNPVESVGVGTTPGSGKLTNYSIGITTYTTFIPTQSIFLPNHPFKNNQQVILRKPIGSSAISVSNTSGGLSFNILSGNSEIVYIVNKSKDYIGIVTNANLTSTGGLFFRSSGTNDYHYSIESNLPQVKVKVDRILSSVSVSTSHQLKIGDEINLEIKPNLSVGIGTSTSVKVKLDSLTQKIVLNPLEFNSSGINTISNSISIISHNLKTGDKILYESLGTLPTGLSTGNYFTYRVDKNTIKLCETLFDAINSPPTTVSISGTGSGSQRISLVNPKIKVIKNNNLCFNLSDPSLSGYELKIFYDQKFEKEFISVPNTKSLSVSGIGTVGVSTNASLTLNYTDSIPEKLYYNLQKSGYISTADTDVINYSEIVFENSLYNGQYNIVSVGDTTFTVSLKQIPESTYYQKDNCDIIQYSTTSQNTTGGISKIKLLSGGYSYRSLPLFTGVDSENGSGAFIIPVSTTIGKIKQSRIINEGFEYSSDKTLRPTASIPQFAYIPSSNTIETINILNGGQNYTSAPDLICINTDSGELIESGLIRSNLSGSSIISLTIENAPKGLPIKPVTIRAINNSNGISIDRIQSSSLGIVTCFLTTPIAGFTSSPFAIGDKIFVEGIQKIGSDGDGFNSSNYGYKFFTITNFQNINPAKLEFSLSGLTTNPGIAKTIQESYATIINFKNYPEFEVVQKFSPFLIGERLSSNTGNGFVVRDLVVVNCGENYVKVSGDYNLSVGEIIRGIESFNEATIDAVKSIDGVYNVDYFNLQKFGWEYETGKLSENFQVTPDNDYYQNLSYSVKSSKTWEEIVTPINNLLHISGMKNFADTQILQNVQSGIGTTESRLSLLNLYASDNRVDTINNLDLVVDLNTLDNKSKFIKFKNIKLTDYILCKTNRVLKIDDISSQFSSNNDESELTGISNILQINSGNNYNRFLIQTRNIFTNEIQFDEIITINGDKNIFTVQKGSLISSNTENLLTNIEGFVDDGDNFYLKFNPEDINNSDFDIKILQDTFTSKIGVGTTQSVGFIDLVSKNKVVSGGITTSIFDLNASKYSAIYSNIHISNSDNSNMNYVEVYLTHDGTNTHISELYFDDDLSGTSSGFIGSFGASISGGILSLNYTNTSSETIVVRTKNVGFGTTAVGVGTYRFKLSGQSDGNERTVVFQSRFNNISSGSTSILVLDKTLFTSSKSVVKIGLGQTSALHQVMVVNDGNDAYSLQYPFISIGSTSGIGTFGAEISGNNFIIKFYADPSVSGNLEILSFSENFYTELDTINIPLTLNYTPVEQSVKVTRYFGANSPSNDRYSFEAKYEDVPIFMKTFDPSDTNVLNPVTGVFTISNHFFNTGEQLIYTPKSTFIGIGTSAMGIGATSNYVGVVTTVLPSVVYAIKDSNNTFRISTRKEYASQGIGVTFTSLGLGNAHQLEMYKKNEKAIITINNVAQSPLAYSNITHTLVGNGGQIGTASTIFALSGIGSIMPTDILKINNEYMRVENVGLGTINVGPITFNGNIPLVEVKRGFVGSTAGLHTDTSIARIYRGSYNIFEDKIFFTQPPRGNSLDLLGPSKYNLPRERATFNGRVFLREDYTSNQIYDDISDQFTGIGQTFILTSQGINTVGLGTSGGNGIIFINNIFQSPTTLNNSSNNYFVSENSGTTNITFTGITSSNNTLFTSEYDINQNQLPRGGIIVSLGSTGGLGIAPLVGASVTAIVGAGGTIISIGTGIIDIVGSGYRHPVSVAVTETGHIGTEAIVSANVGAGGTLSFNIVNPGTGYINPTINVSSPSYENLPVIGVSRLGIGSTSTILLSAAAASFNGTSQLLAVNNHSDFAFNGTSYTIEFFIRNAGSGEIFSLRKDTAPLVGTFLNYDGFGQLQYRVTSGPFTSFAKSFSAPYMTTSNTWIHVALSYDSATTTTSFYVNGSRVSTDSSSNFGNFSYTTIANGFNYFGIAGATVNGSTIINGTSSEISNFRFIVGSALYSGVSISIPSASLTAVTGTKLLLLNSTGNLTSDNSGTNKVITDIGAVPAINGPFNSSVYGSSINAGVAYTTDTGTGLLLNIDVGASSTIAGVGSTLFEVKSFKITRNGYSFRVGDVFKPVGLVTANGLSSPISEFELTVLDVFTDSFSAWQFGELDYIDSVQEYQDGVRTRFPLFYNSKLLSFEIDENDPDSQLIDLDSVLIIFINGVLQEPGVSYQFNGGTTFTFSVAPKSEDNISIFFYRGTRNQDTIQINTVETIKVGDTVEIFSNNSNIENTITQDKRVIYDISGSDKVETNLYANQGIDEINNKPLYWSKQKTDLILNGESIYKSRDSLESQIYPTANIIGDFSNSASEIFVDDSSLFNYENESPINFDAFIFSNESSEQYEIVTNISDVEGYDVSIVGIATTTGIGSPLALKFTLDRDPFSFPDLQVGYPVYISETTVGQGVTSINTSNTDTISISTSFLNNIYQIHAIDSTLGIITCNIASNTSIVGIATTGTLEYPVGRLSWGRLSRFSRSSSPISIGVTGYTSSIGITTLGYSSGLSTYPIIQRRGYGLRNNGSLKKDL